MWSMLINIHTYALEPIHILVPVIIIGSFVQFTKIWNGSKDVCHFQLFLTLLKESSFGLAAN